MTNITYTFSVGIDISKKKLAVSFNETASYDKDLIRVKQLFWSNETGQYRLLQSPPCPNLAETHGEPVWFIASVF